MKRYEFEKAVYESDLDPQSKQILIYYAFRKNWKEKGMAYISATTVAKDTGLSVATVKRRMPRLENRYLCDTGQRRGRGVKVFELVIPEPGSGITETPQTETENGSGIRETPVPVSERHHWYQSDTAAVSERYTEQVREQVEEQVTEQVSKVAAAPPPPDPSLVNDKEEQVEKSLPEPKPSDWLLLDDDERRYFEQVEADRYQRDTAVACYRRAGISGSSWMERADKALSLAGIEVEEW